MKDVESLAESLVDEAMETGEWISEDPRRLRKYLDAYDSEEAIRTVSEAMIFISVGMSRSMGRPVTISRPYTTASFEVSVS